MFSRFQHKQSYHNKDNYHIAILTTCTSPRSQQLWLLSALALLRLSSESCSCSSVSSLQLTPFSTADIDAAIAAEGPEISEARASAQGLAQAWRKGYIGTALTIRNDPVEQYIVQSPQDFDSITPENAMKWDATEPQRNNFTFADADRYANFSQTYNKQLRCHNLVWHSQVCSTLTWCP